MRRRTRPHHAAEAWARSKRGRAFTRGHDHAVPRGVSGSGLWWTALGFTLSGLVLGFSAYLKDGGIGNIADAGFQAIQLLVLESPQPAHSHHTLLRVARWLTAIGVGTVTVYGLWLLFAAQVEHWRAGRQQGHVVVAGLGDHGAYIARSFRVPSSPHTPPLPVVGVELDPNRVSLPTLRGLGVRVLTGDAGDERLGLLQEANLQRARYLVVTCGEDGRNVEIATLAGRLMEGDRKTVPLTVLAHLDDLRLWPQLKSRALAGRDQARFRMEFFNVREAGARVLLDTHRPFPRTVGEGDGDPHVLLVGCGGLGEQVLLQVAQRWNNDPAGESRMIGMTVVGPGARRRIAALAARYPRLGEVVDLVAHDLEFDLAPAEVEMLLDPRPQIAYVCSDRDEDSLSAALALRPPARACGVPVVLVVKDHERGLAPSLLDGFLPGITVFGLVSRALPPELLVRGTNELLAQAKHAHYLEMELLRGVDESANPSAVPWDRLPESLKESNRAFADKIGEKLEAKGCMLVPDPFAVGDARRFTFTDAEVEELAEVEHERWCEDLEAEGWRWGERKDPERKLHPVLVPWAEVQEAERHKDREPIRALPLFLARAGFAIVRADAPEVPPAASEPAMPAALTRGEERS